MTPEEIQAEAKSVAMRTIAAVETQQMCAAFKAMGDALHPMHLPRADAIVAACALLAEVLSFARSSASLDSDLAIVAEITRFYCNTFNDPDPDAARASLSADSLTVGSA